MSEELLAMIRRLDENDAEQLFALRREALLDTPLAFASSPEDDLVATVDAARELLGGALGSVMYGAFRPGLVGMVGLYRDRHRKAAHKVHIWGMYVTPDHRRRGLAAELLEAALRHARDLPGVSWVQLGVSSTALSAWRLYERFGFERWGTEPESLSYDGEIVSQDHLALRLPRTPT